MSDEETVLTSRRALLRATGGWTPGRLRVSDQRIRFTARDGAVVEIARAEVSAVRLARLPRRALVLDTAAGPIRVRCFAMPAIAALLTA